MNDIPFHATRMGVRFYEHTVPEFIRQIARLNDNLERLVDATARDPETTRPSTPSYDQEIDHEEAQPPNR